MGFRQMSERRGHAPERRHVVVAFADIVGSTALSRQLSPDFYFEVIERVRLLIRDVGARHGGVISHQEADATLMIFGFPVANGQDLGNALRASLAIQTEVDALDFSDIDGFVENGCSLRLRIGVNAGSVVLKPRSPEDERHVFEVHGDVPSDAAHFQSLVQPGGVIVSGKVLETAPEGFRFGPAIEFRHKDGPVLGAVHELLGEQPAFADGEPSDTARPMIGREDQLSRLMEAWRAARDGTGSVFCLSGRAGIGKTRLANEALRLMEADGARLEIFQCFEGYEQVPYYPVAQRVRWHLARNGLDHSRIRELPVFQLGAGRHAELFARVLGLLLPETGHRPSAPGEMAEGLVTLLRHLSEAQPIVVLCENMHWADASMRELVAKVAAIAKRARILLIVTSRHGLPLELEGKAEEIAVTPLATAQMEVLCRALRGNAPLEDDTIRRLAGRSDGVPLFAELLVRANALQPGDEDANLPPDMQNLVLAGFSGEDAAYELARTLSTFGEVFVKGDGVALSGLHPAEFEARISRLVQLNVLDETGEQDVFDYRFRHVLYRDALYDTLTTPRRRSLHRQCYSIYSEKLMKGGVDYASAAHHAGEAQQHGEAAENWIRAARAAIGQSANREALAQLSRARKQASRIKVAPQQARIELRAETLSIAPMIAAEGFASPKVREVAASALKKSHEHGQAADRTPLVYALWASHQISGDAVASLEMAGEFLTLASQTGNAGSMSVAYRLRGTSLLARGRVREATADLDRSLVFFPESLRHELIAEFGTDIRVTAQSSLAVAHWLAGRRKAGFDLINAALAEAAELDHKHTLGYAFSYRILLLLLNGDAAEALQLANGMGQIADAQGLPFWKAVAEIYMGQAKSGLGAHAGAVALLEDRLAFRDEHGFGYGQLQHLRCLAESYQAIGREGDARTVMARADRALRDGGETWYEPETLRSRAGLMAASGSAGPEEVAETFETALDRALSQGVLAFWVRAAEDYLKWSAAGDPAAHARRCETVAANCPAELDAPGLAALLPPSP